MIDWNASAELNGMSEDKLRARFVRYPQSNKQVAAICDVCGKERTIQWKQYHELCHKCSHGTPDYIKALRIRTVERFSNPDASLVARDAATKRFSNPTERILASERTTKHFSDPMERKKASDRMNQYYIDHPEAIEACRLGSLGHVPSQEALEKMSVSMKQHYIDHPEAGEEHSRKMLLHHKNNPDTAKRMSETMKIVSVETGMVGGYDIVGHHMIYDHSDLSTNIMEMPRSMHTRLHRLFQKHGIEIPHINIGDC